MHLFRLIYRVRLNYILRRHLTERLFRANCRQTNRPYREIPRPRPAARQELGVYAMGNTMTTADDRQVLHSAYSKLFTQQDSIPSHIGQKKQTASHNQRPEMATNSEP